MSKLHLFLIAATTACFTACSYSPENENQRNLLEGCDVVAERTVTADGDTLVSLSTESLAKDKVIEIPLSSIVEPLEIVRLASPTKEAICGLGPIWISDNYIVTMEGTRNAPGRLFRRDGTFIGTLGQIGKGPGEYQFTINDCHIDEFLNRVYIYPNISPSVLLFDLDANYIGEISIVYRAASCVLFHVSSEGDTVSVLCSCNLSRLTDKEPRANLWHVDTLGNASDEMIIESITQSDGNDFGWLRATQKDQSGMTLYSDVNNESMLLRFDAKSFKVKPVFAVRLSGPSQKAQISVTPHYYLIRFYDSSLYGTDAFNIEFAIVDKTTLKGSRCRIYNDMLSGIDLSFWNPAQGLFYELTENNGYGFGFMYDSGDFIDKIERRLEEPSLSETDREYLTRLKDSISPDDNNIVILGRFRL